MEVNRFTDQEIVAAILANDSKMIEYFFCQKCSRMLSYIAVSMFNKRVDHRELISELLLYIAADNWRKLAQFDFRSSLMTWMRVVSIRFFQKIREDLIESGRNEALITLNNISCSPLSTKEQKMDVSNAISKMKNQRYRDAIIALDFEDRKPEDVAQQWGISVDNLYNIHHRALVQLKTILGKKEDYYD